MNKTGRGYAGEPDGCFPPINKNLQTPHNVRCNAERRGSPHASCRGSLTLETALALPFLLCAVAALLSIFSMTAVQGRKARALMERAQTLAVTVGASQSDPYIKLYDYSGLSLPYGVLGFGSQSTVQKAVVRAWIGYAGEEDFGRAETFVYITPEGTVYHKSADCTYLRLSIRSIPAGGLETARNLSGSGYDPCETCVKNEAPAGSVYVTDYGDRYHNRRSCSGLKRTVMMVPLREAAGRRACSKCGGE